MWVFNCKYCMRIERENTRWQDRKGGDLSLLVYTAVLQKILLPCKERCGRRHLGCCCHSGSLADGAPEVSLVTLSTRFSENTLQHTWTRFWGTVGG